MGESRLFSPFFGGTFNNGANVSPRYRNCNNGFGNANWNYGSRQEKPDDET